MKRGASLKRKTPLRAKAPLRSVAAKPKRKVARKRPPMKRCDDLARAINKARARGECEGRYPGHRCRGSLQWAHIVTRSEHSIRHDEDNALLLCSGAHLYFTQRPLVWEEFVGEERMLALKQRARAMRGERIDWTGREAALRARAASLGLL